MSIMRYKRMLTCGGAVAFGGGGKGGGTTVVPAPPPPPPPPPPEEEAQMTEFTDEEANKLQRKAITQGAKSLQIPIGGTTDSATLGTA